MHLSGWQSTREVKIQFRTADSQPRGTRLGSFTPAHCQIIISRTCFRGCSVNGNKTATSFSRVLTTLSARVPVAALGTVEAAAVHRRRTCAYLPMRGHQPERLPMSPFEDGRGSAIRRKSTWNQHTISLLLQGDETCASPSTDAMQTVIGEGDVGEGDGLTELAAEEEGCGLRYPRSPNEGLLAPAPAPAPAPECALQSRSSSPSPAVLLSPRSLPDLRARNETDALHRL